MNHKLKVSCRKDQLQSIRDFVYAHLKNYTLSDITLSQLILAVDEVCSNLMIHSHDCNPHHTIEVAVEVKDSTCITFEISDQGKSFNFRAYREPCIADIIKARKKGGVGLLLVKRIMDRMEYDYDEDTQRNIYRLQKFTNVTRRAPVTK